MRQCLLVVGVWLCINCVGAGVGMLYPRDSESRQSKLLDGVWNFRADDSPGRNRGFDQKWWTLRLFQTGPVIDMPVPSSYNDITEDRNLRDFVGWVWYDREFFLSADWVKNNRVVLRIDSAHYNAIVWVNGVQVAEHSGGHLPFEGEVVSYLKLDGPNYVTVAVNNTLSPTTLPPGGIQYQKDTSKYPAGYFVQAVQMDFFNYAGIHRHVLLYTTPTVYIDDITILTSFHNDLGLVDYSIVVSGGTSQTVNVSILDLSGVEVAHGNHRTGTLSVPNANFWWPFGMNGTTGYLYTLQVKLDKDVYRQPFGIRTVQVTENQILINEKPFYCHGVGKHEDADIRGKGLDYALIAKDFNMLRWLGVNCIRTSHYPYAEEILEFADRQGVAVIDESPAVGVTKPENFGNESLQHHLNVMAEMIRRDKNKPSVIIWSVANEPATNLAVAVPYFRSVLQFTRDTDPAHRPTTFTTAQTFETDRVSTYADIICINRYYGWYYDMGHLEVVQPQLRREFAGFRNLYKKPIIVTEYGADSVLGLHREPSMAFTEEYQTEFLEQYHIEFDRARQQFLAGEMVWNFADFMTVQEVYRVEGNKKGLLTRQRQPKPAAYLIRERYHDLASGRNASCGYRRAAKYTAHPHTYPKH